VWEAYQNGEKRNRGYFESQEYSLSPKHNNTFFASLRSQDIYRSRGEAEVKTTEFSVRGGLWKGVQVMKGKNVPFVPLIFSRSEVIDLFLSGHRIPNLVSLAKTNISTWQSFTLGSNANVLVLPSIVRLGSNKQDNIVSCDTQEDLVAGVIERFIFILIDLH
jgi:hypothetical protein